MRVSPYSTLTIPDYDGFVDQCRRHWDIQLISGLPVAVLEEDENFAVSIEHDKLHIRQTLGLFQTSLIVYTLKNRNSDKTTVTAYFQMNSAWVIFFSFLYLVVLCIPIILFLFDKIDSRMVILSESYWAFIGMFICFIFMREAKRIKRLVDGIISTLTSSEKK